VINLSLFPLFSPHLHFILVLVGSIFFWIFNLHSLLTIKTTYRFSWASTLRMTTSTSLVFSSRNCFRFQVFIVWIGAVISISFNRLRCSFTSTASWLFLIYFVSIVFFLALSWWNNFSWFSTFARRWSLFLLFRSCCWTCASLFFVWWCSLW